ncbi:MAG: VUT family protein [Spirochaetaceae bacterium]|nr:VUT family protein [Spirochaetaceae bacterium]
MKKIYQLIRREHEDFKLLMRSIPSLTITLFVLSVVCANLMANKELVNYKYVAVDCGTVFSWIMFLCMDVICKRWGGRAAMKVSMLALVINLGVCGSFALLSLAPGKWGSFYDSGLVEVNSALNTTFGGSWYVVLGSSIAFLISSAVNALLNSAIGAATKLGGFKAFALRSYVSTAVAQLVDNLIFTTLVSKIFFGWTWTQVLVCALIQAAWELLCEVLFSGLGYKVVCSWEQEQVGQDYLTRRGEQTA